MTNDTRKTGVSEETLLRMKNTYDSTRTSGLGTLRQ